MGAMLLLPVSSYGDIFRLKEFGIHIALGAQRKEVLQAALGRAFKLLAFGSAGCSRTSCFRQLPVIRWFWLVLFSRCRCWD